MSSNESYVLGNGCKSRSAMLSWASPSPPAKTYVQGWKQRRGGSRVGGLQAVTIWGWTSLPAEIVIDDEFSWNNNDGGKLRWVNLE